MVGETHPRVLKCDIMKKLEHEDWLDVGYDFDSQGLQQISISYNVLVKKDVKGIILI